MANSNMLVSKSGALPVGGLEPALELVMSPRPTAKPAVTVVKAGDDAADREEYTPASRQSSDTEQDVNNDRIVIDEERKGFWVFIRRRTLIVTAWGLLFLGVLATIAPTPFGILLVGAALTMLLTHSPWTKLRFRRYIRRYPQTLSPLLRIPSIKEAIKIRKRRRKARRRAKQAAREHGEGLRDSGGRME
ncbi:MAG: hypothetical protein AAFY56_15095 [Pseudomonadota bacterium]